MEWLSADATPEMLAAQAREVRTQEALRSHQDRARCVTAVLTVPDGQCNERLRAVAATVQQEALTAAAKMCKKPGLTAANFELEVSSQLATSGGRLFADEHEGAAEAAAARDEGERHYQVALSHMERGSLAAACSALRHAKLALASLDPSPSAAAPTTPLPGIMAENDDGNAMSLARVTQLENRLVQHISNVLLHDLRGRVAGNTVAEAVQMLSEILPASQAVSTLGHVLCKIVEDGRTQKTLEECEESVNFAAIHVPAAVAGSDLQRDVRWEQAIQEVFVRAACMIVQTGLGWGGRLGAGELTGLMTWSKSLVLTLHFESARLGHLLGIAEFSTGLWTSVLAHGAPVHVPALVEDALLQSFGEGGRDRENQKHWMDCDGAGLDGSAEWEGAEARCRAVAGCAVDLMPLAHLEPVPGYMAAVVAGIKKVAGTYHDDLESRIGEELVQKGVSALHPMVCSLLLLYRVCLKIQRMAPASGEGHSGPADAETRLNVDAVMGTLLEGVWSVLSRIVEAHSALVRDSLLLTVEASAWSRRQWIQKRASPTPSHGLLLLNLYMAGLAHDLVAGGDGCGVRLPVQVCEQVLGSIWEQLAGALVGVYSRVHPSRANQPQMCMDVNYVCLLLSEWAGGRVHVGEHALVLSEHHAGVLRSASSVLASWCTLKAAPPAVLLQLVTRSASPLPSAAGASHANSSHANSDQPPREPPRSRVNVLEQFHRIAGMSGPTVAFSSSLPTNADLRILDMQNPKTAAMVRMQ